MCYLASNISALAAECPRFALGQVEGIENKKGRRGERGGNCKRLAGVDGGMQRECSERAGVKNEMHKWC